MEAQWQTDFVNLVQQVPELMETLAACRKAGVADAYLVGGVLTQTVWNHLSGHVPLAQVKDFDVAYFDAASPNREQAFEKTVRASTSHDFPVDVTNQAYVHTWYERKFGVAIAPHKSVEDGIATYLPAFSVGIKLTKGDQLSVLAPFGLSDLMGMIVRPNKRAMPRDTYDRLCASYKARWPNITVIEWGN